MILGCLKNILRIRTFGMTSRRDAMTSRRYAGEKNFSPKCRQSKFRKSQKVWSVYNYQEKSYCIKYSAPVLLDPPSPVQVGLKQYVPPLSLPAQKETETQDANPPALKTTNEKVNEENKEDIEQPWEENKALKTALHTLEEVM